MVKPSPSGKRMPIRYIALVGVLAATLECGKLALSFLPNIEIVTLFTALYGYVFGVWGVAAALVFVLIEPMIYGFGTWIISYCIYWPLVAIVFMILGRIRLKNRVVLTIIAVLLTAFFGVLSSFVDIGLFSGRFDNFFYRFGIYYMRGIWFYIAETVTNAVLFPLLFRPISDRFRQIRRKMFGK